MCWVEVVPWIDYSLSNIGFIGSSNLDRTCYKGNCWNLAWRHQLHRLALRTSHSLVGVLGNSKLHASWTCRSSNVLLHLVPSLLWIRLTSNYSNILNREVIFAWTSNASGYEYIPPVFAFHGAFVLDDIFAQWIFPISWYSSHII